MDGGRRIADMSNGDRLLYCVGLVAGAVQTLVTTPVDLLKIRMQLQTALPGQPHYTGNLRLLSNIVTRDGLQGTRLSSIPWQVYVFVQSTGRSLISWYIPCFPAYVTEQFGIAGKESPLLGPQTGACVIDQV